MGMVYNITMTTPTLGAHILTMEEFLPLRASLGKIVAASGGFDPIHPGHISYIMDSKALGDTLVVIVNGDAFLRAKKGKAFQDLATRCMIISALKGVDYVVPFEIENDQTVIKALDTLRPHIFSKGGDRVDAATIPEWDTCQRHSIEVVSGVGLGKEWSSSLFLNDWKEHVIREHLSNTPANTLLDPIH